VSGDTQLYKNITNLMVTFITYFRTQCCDYLDNKIGLSCITDFILLVTVRVGVGRTLVFFMSKRQGAIETSTRGAEFCAMRTAVEEVQFVRYILRCLGVKVNHASLMWR